MKPWLSRSFLLALALLCTGELVVRLFFARNMSGRFEYGYHPTAGFQENSDGTVRLVRAGGRRFHPQSFSQARPEGTYRVLVIGDSVPRGPSLESSYPRLLAGELGAAGLKAESYNLAVPGYGSRRKQIVLEQALKYHPSLIILHVNGSNEYEDEREYKRSAEFKSWHPRNWPMKSLVIRRLYEAKTEQMFWNWLPVEVRAQRAANDADAEVSASINPEKVRVWDERVRRITTESAALARSSGVPVLLVTQATLDRTAPGRPTLDEGNLETLGRSLEQPMVGYLSMKKVLETNDYLNLFSDTSHLKREGHRILAEAIVTWLRQHGWIQPPPAVQSPTSGKAGELER